VEAVGVRRVFESAGRQVAALDGVNASVRPGELVAVMGRSGSGKTTLLNLLGGLDDPTSGEVRFGGRRIADLSADERSRLRRGAVGFVFQSFGLLPLLSAEENVELALRIAGVRPKERRARAAAAMEAVGITGRAKHRPAELSGGEQQRAAIARALAPSPSLILADEPTGELDSTNAAAIFSILRQLADSQGVAIAVASHDPALVEIADRVITLADGRAVPGG
jgi:putative ABC transport system ATP-binding protein